ncbi:MAG: hypothetical protein OXH52_15335 [Gammaproteobacteria bacterium]|nr:hypothetical protein [Gammaproteobacteria bacterium]
MVPNAKYWAHYFREFHVRVIEGFRAGALEKVATAFGGIAEEAERAAEAEFERLGSMPADDWVDMGDVAEWAQDHGILYYETMSGVRQGVLNLLAVGLHHLFEQQQLIFLRRELARDEKRALSVGELERRLARLGVDCRSFRSAGKLYELRKAANAIKHGAGPAAKELAALRPDLFEDPVLANHGLAKRGVAGSDRVAMLAASLSEPLAGEDLYVSERDLAEWCTAVVDYWKELSTILDDQHRRQVTG